MRRLSLDEYKNCFNSNRLLVDIRTPKEFHMGSIYGAFNVNFSCLNFISNFKDVRKDTPIILFCQSGKRSLLAMQILKRFGFQNIADLRGGFREWKKLNYYEKEP